MNTHESLPSGPAGGPPWGLPAAIVALAAGSAALTAFATGGAAAPTLVAAAAAAAIAGLAFLMRARFAAHAAARDALAAQLEREHRGLARARHESADASRHAMLAVLGSGEGVWEADLRTGEVWSSEGFESLFGFDAREFAKGLEALEPRIHPDDRERWRGAVEAQKEHHASYNLDLRLRTPEGEYRWYRVRGQAECDETGTLERLSGAFLDIHERHFAAEKLRDSEASFRSLSAASPAGILKADANGQCSYVNERWQEICGLDEFEAMGDGWQGALHAEDQDRVVRCWRIFTGAGGTFDQEYRVTAPEDGVRWVRMRANPVLDARGATAGFVATLEDVTEGRRAAAALAEARDRAMQAARAKSEFLANMSHEIRTPLNGVIGMSELLHNTSLDDEQRDFVRTITTSADALLTIINDILDFSKIEAGKMTIERVPLDLRGLAEDVGEILALRGRERGLELVLAVDPSLPRRLLGDPTRIRQILINLATNAIKFTEQGQVVIGATAMEREGWVKLWVRDSGIGIPAERLGAVFESFTQADGSTTRKYGGTGLGLTICRQLAGLMGGTIHVASQPGEGSTFWVELPLPAAPDEAAVFEAAADLSGVHVLVVDDLAVNRGILLETLRGWGMRPESAASGEEALGKLTREGGDPFEVVLADHHMPGMDGLELAARIHALHALHGRPSRRVAILSHSSATPVDGAADSGEVHAWLGKPLREATLHRMLCALLGRAPMQAGPPPEEPRESFAGLRLLLAEDNEVNRKVALRMLGRLGCTAEIAQNGVEAVQFAGEGAYDIVFMDCQMPELDGFAATAAIRQRERERGGHVRIVAMTANAMEGDRERCLAAGMDAYVAKPVRIETLAEQLRLVAALQLPRAA